MLALCSRAEAKNQRSDHADISKFTKEHTTKKIPKEMILYTDCEEVVPVIFHNESTLKAIDKLKNYLVVRLATLTR